MEDKKEKSTKSGIVAVVSILALIGLGAFIGNYIKNMK